MMLIGSMPSTRHKSIITPSKTVRFDITERKFDDDNRRLVLGASCTPSTPKDNLLHREDHPTWGLIETRRHVCAHVIHTLNHSSHRERDHRPSQRLGSCLEKMKSKYPSFQEALGLGWVIITQVHLHEGRVLGCTSRMVLVNCISN